MATQRIRSFLGGVLVVSGLATALPGCGGGGPEQTTGPGKEVQIAPPLNPTKGSVPINEEYKNLSPAGKASSK